MRSKSYQSPEERSNKGTIEFGIVLLVILQQFFLSANSFLVLSLVVLTLYGIRYCRIISRYFPRGFALYLLWGIVALMIGIVNGHPITYIARTTSYWLNGVVSILLGIIIVLKAKNKENIISTLLLIEFGMTIYCFISLMISGAYGTFNSLRLALSTNIVSLEFIFPLLLINKYIKNKIYFSRAFDNTMIVAFSIRLLLCLSRTTIIGIAVGCFLYFLLLDKETKEKLSTNAKAVGIVLIIIVFVSVFIFFMPDTIGSLFTGKMKNIFNEIKINEAINSYAGALSNWRAYENQEALSQFGQYSFFEKVFGEGFGSMIQVQFMSSAWAGMEFYGGNRIPILHNSYFTVLCLGGIAGLISFIHLFTGNILYGLKLRNNQNASEHASSFLVLYMIMALNSYVTRGLFSSEIYLSWGVLTAFYIFKLRTNS